MYWYQELEEYLTNELFLEVNWEGTRRKTRKLINLWLNNKGFKGKRRILCNKDLNPPLIIDQNLLFAYVSLSEEKSSRLIIVGKLTKEIEEFYIKISNCYKNKII